MPPSSTSRTTTHLKMSPDDRTHDGSNADDAADTGDPSNADDPTDRDGVPALVAARADDERPDTAEITALAAAAGYDVVGTVTQQRREDPTYGLGRGRAEDLMRLAAETGAEAVVYDGSLSPGQTFSLGDLLPRGVAVLDRPRLVLERSADAADSGAAELQLELARLRYELPRLRETVARDTDGDARLRPEGDGPVRDLERRIDAIETDLDGLVDDRAGRRRQRRESGFDLVAVVGYANAGKSRLCRRLADDVDDPESPDGAAGHDGATDDGGSSLAVGNRLFETVTTTTRRATMDGRPTVVTDTVGFVDGIPHDAIRSFRATLAEARDADCVLLVVDASDEPAALRRKLRASLSAIRDADAPVLPVLNKTDRLDDAALEGRVGAYEAAVDELAAEDVPVVGALRAPIAVSGRDGAGLSSLRAAIVDVLPTATATVEAANGGETQAALSWAYDRGVVADVAYAGDAVRVDLAGRPAVVDEARRRLTPDG